MDKGLVETADAGDADDRGDAADTIGCAQVEASAAVTPNPWRQLRQFTSARIALGRVGTSVPTAPHLQFQFDHARARNAVHRPANFPALAQAFSALGLSVEVLQSAAPTRPVYLQRPDKGRRLSADAVARLDAVPAAQKGADLVFVVGDGLSSLAIEKNAAKLLQHALPELQQHGLRVGPLCVVENARVAIGDEIAQQLGAQMVVVLIGERPGLSSPDSLGIYLTWQPKVGLTDESRNCISNVRPEGLSYAAATRKLLYLVLQARAGGFSGVLLKDESDALAIGASEAAHLQQPKGNFLSRDTHAAQAAEGVEEEG